MKTIGMIGGMSWESSAVYYRIVNREVQRRLGGVHSAKVLLWSFDLGEIEALQAAGDWKAAAQRMREAASALARGGADFLIICCNTMHILAEAVENASALPLLHIATPLGAAIHARDLRKVGVLGTRYTMAADFLRSPLVRDHSVEFITPGEEDAEETHRLIYEELSRGQFLDSSASFLRSAIQRLADRGAEGVILGCTELSLLVKPEESEIPLLDTTELHALAAVDRALA
ncbi:MAG TPA: aspartate/glutamate racemase family protein [Rhizomicrobium sp.]|jgi:aspartate racemase|nr:aspartate/glutamate racemase family protein [Rhizomicrobium sp.]